MKAFAAWGLIIAYGLACYFWGQKMDKADAWAKPMPVPCRITHIGWDAVTQEPLLTLRHDNACVSWTVPAKCVNAEIRMKITAGNVWIGDPFPERPLMKGVCPGDYSRDILPLLRERRDE